MDLDNLLRTYLHVNDPKYQGLTYKFAGGVLVLALALGISAWASSVNDATDGANGFFAATAPDNDGDAAERLAAGDAARVYVGYDPASFAVTKGYDRERVDGALQGWIASHPDAAIDGAPAPELRDGLVIGYWISYR